MHTSEKILMMWSGYDVRTKGDDAKLGIQHITFHVHEMHAASMSRMIDAWLIILDRSRIIKLDPHERTRELRIARIFSFIFEKRFPAFCLLLIKHPHCDCPSQGECYIWKIIASMFVFVHPEIWSRGQSAAACAMKSVLLSLLFLLDAGRWLGYHAPEVWKVSLWNVWLINALINGSIRGSNLTQGRTCRRRRWLTRSDGKDGRAGHTLPQKN